MFIVPRHEHCLETFDRLRSVLLITAQLQKEPNVSILIEFMNYI